MPEKVTFGRAIDAMHAYIIEMERDRGPGYWTITMAAALAMAAAEDDADSWALVEDKDTFAVQVSNALSLFASQPDGLARMRTRITPDLRIQGDNGRSLTHDDLVGTPDYYDEQGPIDVKTAARSYNASKFHQSAEMPVYALLWSAENGGEVPPLLAYQVYVRKSRPEWQWLEVPGTAAHIELGRLRANRWRKGLANGDYDLFAVDLNFCSDCAFKNPMPEVAHGGCAFGLAAEASHDAA
ncbi:MAG: hypothetical protein IT345_10520 [Trueperaceae bacterium]|nr:hypothetical protein [Trueperaceae bacterium]